MKALSISCNDEVLVTPRSYISSASSVLNIGAKPVFVDVEENSGNICPNDILKKITTKTKAIIVVHLAGWPCKMKEIMDISKKNNIYVIEDCAQAHGAMIDNKYVGSFGDIATWSFCQDKIISTIGEGGMISTNSSDLWKKIWSLKDIGRDYDAVYNKKHSIGFKWIHEHIGSNARMTESQSAVGRYQLKKLEKWIKQRNSNANFIINSFKNFEEYVFIPQPENNITHAYYKLYVYLHISKLKGAWSRDKILSEFNKLNIPVTSGSCSEIYLEKSFRDKGYGKKRLKNAKYLGECSLMFQVHPSLTKEDLRIIKNSIIKVFKKIKND